MGVTTVAVPSVLPRTDATRVFHALSDPVRLDVIELLGDGEHCVCDISDCLDIAQSRLSFHLKVLKDAGIVSDRREGRWVHYTLVRGAFDDATAALARLRPRSRRLLTLTAGCCD